MTTEFFEITYYGYGMTPQRLQFDDEGEARNAWDHMKNDPHAGAYSLRKITVLDQVR